MRQHLIQATTIPGVAVTISIMGGCFAYAPQDPQVRALARMSYPAPAIGPEDTISAIAAGDPASRRVIYVHGTPGSANDWGSFLVDPAPGLEHVAIDRPGFGKSSGTGAVTSLALQAAAIEPLLVERDGRWPILVGHSLGGPIVARVAAEHPGRVGGVVIVAGALDPDLEKVLLIQRIGNIPLLDLLVPRTLRTANRELIPLEGELRELEPLLGNIKAPIVIIHGTEDSLVPYANVAFMERAFAGNPSVEVITLEGEDHFTIWTSPTTISGAIGSLR